MPALRSVRRLRRGAVSVELDYDGAHVLMRCQSHRTVERVPLGHDGLGPLLVAFFAEHEPCSLRSPFDIVYADVPPPADLASSQPRGGG